MENTLDKVKLSSMDIENSIRRYSLEFPSCRDVKVEWKIDVPKFVYPFYDFIVKRVRIPTQEEFWAYYNDFNGNAYQLRSLGLSKEQTDGLRARVFRTYPSLVRDIHFATFLRDGNEYELVFYNEELDISYGVDLIVKKNGRTYGLNLFTDTKRANYARNVKKDRKKIPIAFECVDLSLSFKGSKKCGEFYLYGRREKDRMDQLFM